jgi:hypothetical protein
VPRTVVPRVPVLLAVRAWEPQAAVAPMMAAPSVVGSIPAGPHWAWLATRMATAGRSAGWAARARPRSARKAVPSPVAPTAAATLATPAIRPRPGAQSQRVWQPVPAARPKAGSPRV